VEAREVGLKFGVVGFELFDSFAAIFEFGGPFVRWRLVRVPVWTAARGWGGDDRVVAAGIAAERPTGAARVPGGGVGGFGGASKRRQVGRPRFAPRVL